MTDPEAWRQKRREAAAAHADALAQKNARESRQARALIAEFIVAARERGVAPEPLVVQGYGGKGTARSQVTGWYLRYDKTVGVGEDGDFYVLTAPLTLLDRMRGRIRIVPTDPPLVIGQGGRDGEAMDMADALARALGQEPDA